MKLIIILLGLGVLAYLIWDDRERYAQLRKFKRLVRKSRRQARKESWQKIRNSAANPRKEADENGVVVKRTNLYGGVILEFCFPEYRYSNLDFINETLSQYVLKEVTVKEHTGALVAPENMDSGANRVLQYAIKTCTLQCNLMSSGCGLDLRISTMAIDKTVKDCALVWQQRNPDRKLCKKVFRELKNAYVLVVVHHDKTRQLPEREIIPRTRKPQARTTRVSSGTVPVSSGRPSVFAPVSSGPVPVSSPAGPSQAASGKITVRQEGDTLYISGRETLWPSNLVAYSEFKKVVLGPEIPYIGHAAFRGRTNLTAITIPDSVRIICGDAFLGCTGLTQISIPGSVLEIADETFRGCTHLTSVTIANGVRKIGSGVFRGCTGLTDIVIPDSVEEIHEYAFHGCTNLRNIRISRGVKVIAKSTFMGCSSLTNIAIADGVVKIDREAFSGCTGLTNIVIPDSVLKIGKKAFAGCTGLTSLTIPTNCRRIGDNAFQDVPHIRYDGAVWKTDNWGAKEATWLQGKKYFCGRSGKDTLVWHMVDDTLYIEGQGRLRCSENNWLPYMVRHVVIAPGCTAIADYAFCGHRILESIDLPDTLRTIGPRAFAHCTGLKEIKIPDSVVGIGTGAFAECIRLQRIQLPEKLSQIHDDTFKYCRKLENVQIPDRVRYIGKHAFCEVRSVANLPSNLGNWGNRTPACAKRGYGLGEGAFENMKEMVKLHCKTCGRLNDEPLKVYNEDSFDGAEIAAYDSCIHWNNQIPVPGAKLVVRVESPFCCTVGGNFWAGYSDSQFVQAKLLSILSMDKYEAEIRVEVLDIKDRLSFVKPVSVEEKKRMLEAHTYAYCEPCGDAPNPQIIRNDAGILHFFNSWGGGDVNYDDYIYTDPDGIDHLILKEYSDFEGAYSFVGDEILGFHTDSPYQWENGLLIDWKSKTVIGCADGVTEAVIPQGIVRLGWFSFKPGSRLERITIPDSVTRIHNAFYESPKEVILTGNSRLTENDLLEVCGAQIHRIP